MTGHETREVIDSFEEEGNKTKRFAKQLASDVVIAKLIFKNWRPNFNNSHTHTLKMCDNERKISMAKTQSLNVPYKRVHQNV